MLLFLSLRRYEGSKKGNSMLRLLVSVKRYDLGIASLLNLDWAAILRITWPKSLTPSPVVFETGNTRCSTMLELPKVVKYKKMNNIKTFEVYFIF